MCGILIVHSKKNKLDLHQCKRALSTLYWRGPDFEYSNVWQDRLFLGQTVLSITGNPNRGLGSYNRSLSKRFELYYNGEIYNHQTLRNKFLPKEHQSYLQYGTDTEVLVNLHDKLSVEEIPSHLDGMYAYGVLDVEAHKLHLVRDVQGEKSLYIYEDDNLIVVASEIRAIRSLVPSISLNEQALRDYFYTRHLMLFGRTVYQKIREIPPGALLTLDLNSSKWLQKEVTSFRHWIDPKKIEENSKKTENDLIDELDSLLSDSIREMLPSDRKYASVVSGGIDSSLLSHYVVKHGNPDLLIAVNNIGKDRISNDLSGFEKVLDRPIHILQVDAASYISEIGRCQNVCGSPLNAHSFIPQSQQSAFVRSQGCKVLLGGEGADELFGGYSCYLEPTSNSQNLSPSFYTGYQEPPLQFDRNNTSPLRDDLLKLWKESWDAYSFIENTQDRLIMSMTYADAAYQLPQVGLRSADLMSMMWSIETRSIFLRKSIVQFALNLPASLKVNRSSNVENLLKTKYLLKKLFLRIYPQNLLFEKQGFAGFPNESLKYLGAVEDFQSIQALQVDPKSLVSAMENKACAWKLINVEYFLRQF